MYIPLFIRVPGTATDRKPSLTHTPFRAIKMSGHKSTLVYETGSPRGYDELGVSFTAKMDITWRIFHEFE